MRESVVRRRITVVGMGMRIRRRAGLRQMSGHGGWRERNGCRDVCGRVEVLGAGRCGRMVIWREGRTGRGRIVLRVRGGVGRGVLDGGWLGDRGRLDVL
jgi:hypothetical protein